MASYTPIGKLKGIRHMLSALQGVCFSNIDITIRVKATGLKYYTSEVAEGRIYDD